MRHNYSIMRTTTLSLAETTTLCMCLWAIWSRRNSKLWENKEETTQECVFRSHSIYSTWHLASISSTSVQQHVSVTEKWTKPPTRVLKCNIDASFDEGSNTIGFGLCIREHLGQFILVKTEHSWPLFGVKEGEATTVLMALKWFHELGVGSIILETNCKVVIDNIHSTTIDVNEFGDLISACKNFLSVHPTF